MNIPFIPLGLPLTGRVSREWFLFWANETQCLPKIMSLTKETNGAFLLDIIGRTDEGGNVKEPWFDFSSVNHREMAFLWLQKGAVTENQLLGLHSLIE